MEITVLLSLLCLASQFLGSTADISSGTDDDSQLWGYVDVRPKAHIFWWYYRSPQRVSSPAKPWPTILWLPAGPGGSGTGQGNFERIGPLDVNLKPRNSTWLQKADLIFVDSPVGVGYSYVDDPSALATTDGQATMDMVELIKALANEIPTLQSSPLYLVGESYGGKHAAMIGVSLARSIRAGSLNLTLGGVVLGDSWISPGDFALSYPFLLHAMSRLDDNVVPTATRMGMTVKQQVAAEQFSAAYKTFQDLHILINSGSGQVNLENILVDNPIDVGPDFGPNTTSGLMNGVMKEQFNEKLNIVAKDLNWLPAALNVFDAMNGTFMRPAINEVDKLLMYNLNVSVYSGQLDFICSTIGTEEWVKNLRWDGLHNFLSLPRKALYPCPPYLSVNGFVRSYKNLKFYWILGAGHQVPVDQPCMALHMIGNIVQSPAV